MWFPNAVVLLSAAVAVSSTPVTEPGVQHLEKRSGPQFAQGEPIDGTGKGGPILGKCIYI